MSLRRMVVALATASALLLPAGPALAATPTPTPHAPAPTATPKKPVQPRKLFTPKITFTPVAGACGTYDVYVAPDRRISRAGRTSFLDPATEIPVGKVTRIAPETGVPTGFTILTVWVYDAKGTAIGSASMTYDCKGGAAGTTAALRAPVFTPVNRLQCAARGAHAPVLFTMTNPNRVAVRAHIVFHSSQDLMVIEDLFTMAPGQRVTKRLWLTQGERYTWDAGIQVGDGETAPSRGIGGTYVLDACGARQKPARQVVVRPGLASTGEA